MAFEGVITTSRELLDGGEENRGGETSVTNDTKMGYLKTAHDTCIGVVRPTSETGSKEARIIKIRSYLLHGLQITFSHLRQRLR